MHLVGELRYSVLLLNIEAPLINAICIYCVSKLPARHVVKNKSLLACIYNLSIVESLKLLCKLCLLGKLCKCIKYLIVYLLCSVIICKPLRHRCAV